MANEEQKSLLLLFKKLQESPSYYMKQVIQKYERVTSNILVNFELTTTQIELLSALAVLINKRTSVSQNELANFVQRDKNTVSEVLRTLEKKGYISRFPDPSDKRAKSLVITEKGLNIIENAVNEVLTLDEQFFPVEKDRKELIELLKQYL